MSEKLKPFLAGFDLVAQRLPNGKLHSYYGLQTELMDDWPKKVELAGNTYTLERVVKGDEGHESAEYA